MDEKNGFVTVAMFEEGIERLARLINANFVEMEKRVTCVENGLTNTKDELHAVETRLTRRINDAEDHLSACFIRLSEDVERHENLLGEHDGRLKYLEKRVV